MRNILGGLCDGGQVEARWIDLYDKIKFNSLCVCVYCFLSNSADIYIQFKAHPSRLSGFEAQILNNGRGKGFNRTKRQGTKDINRRSVSDNWFLGRSYSTTIYGGTASPNSLCPRSTGTPPTPKE